jgi:hypothetical protein
VFERLLTVHLCTQAPPTSDVPVCAIAVHGDEARRTSRGDADAHGCGDRVQRQLEVSLTKRLTECPVPNRAHRSIMDVVVHDRM